MEYKLENGDYVLGSTGLPLQVSGLEALLQNARMALSMERGAYLYDAALGSRLKSWNEGGEGKTDRAVSLANEALLTMPGVRVSAARKTETGLAFTVKTPLGEGEIEIGNI